MITGDATSSPGRLTPSVVASLTRTGLADPGGCLVALKALESSSEDVLNMLCGEGVCA